MNTKITQKIDSVAVVKNSEPVTTHVVLQRMNESMKRPEFLDGRTYKIKPPKSEHAVYLTINYVVLNEGTEHESRQPFEIFINSKDVENHQWVTALTLLVSAIFRKGGDAVFMVDELKSVFDPNGGGYLSRRGHIPSLVAEIGMYIETYFKHLGLIRPDVDVAMQVYIEQKKDEYTSKGGTMDKALICKKCMSKTVVLMDGCPTCLTCGDSKCS